VSDDHEPLSTIGLVKTGAHPGGCVFADCTQRIYSFPNGYGASIVTGHVLTNGADFELAVMHNDVKGCVYDTPVTRDVERGDAADMNSLLAAIYALPVRQVNGPASIDALDRLRFN